jgi:UDP-N-acetylglucosamine--N-acetylmuramyl-(pentapeptide) pyrophosphoryl-undecaprenol N-acetylglucosamine transferase
VKRKIVIAAGGTGGHIYPALAMAEAFLRAYPDSSVAFVGTASGLENKIIPSHGFPVHHLPIGRLNANVSLGERIKTVLSLPVAFIKSAMLLNTLKPDFVLGVGGHASGPLLLVASLLKYKTAIWEPNAMPGLANRWLSRFVDECWVVFDEAKPLLHNSHLRRAGMPVRKDIDAMSESSHVTGNKKTFHVLVFGGSQGSRKLNDLIQNMIHLGGEWLSDLQFVHQTGAADFERIKDAYSPTSPVTVREYLHDMPDQYAWADLVVCRSGTGTLSELAAAGKAAILIPLPTAADDHQTKNAMSLVRQNAAELLVQKDLTPEILRDKILELKKSPERLHQMAQNIRTFHQPKAAELLVEQFVERMNSSEAR